MTPKCPRCNIHMDAWFTEKAPQFAAGEIQTYVCPHCRHITDDMES